MHFWNKFLSNRGALGVLSNVLKRYSSILIVCIVFFFALHRFVVPRVGMFEVAASYITYPVLVLHSYTITPFQNFFARRTTIKELQSHIDQLQTQLTDVQAQLTALQAKKHIIQQTKDIRDCVRWYDTKYKKLAHVVAKQLNAQQQTFLVNAGSRQGVTVDMVAIYKNNLIGRVATVYPTYSKIQLITDAGCKVAAYCAKTKAQGIYEGGNDSRHAAFNFVSHLETVVKGDKVISSGQGVVFPQGFALGKIVDIAREGLYHKIAVTPLIDVASIEYVYLIQK